MRELLRGLRLILLREQKHARRLLDRARRFARSARSQSRRALLRNGGRRDASRPHPPVVWRRRQDRGALRPLLVSLALHLALLAVVFLGWRDDSSPGGPAPERRVTVRWTTPVKPSAPEAEELPQPSPAPEPARVEAPTPAERAATESTPKNQETAREALRPSSQLAAAVEVPLNLPALLTPPPLGTGARTATSGDAGRLSPRGRAGRRGRALRRFGGGGTEDAVARGLRWLAAHQDENGGWSARRFPRHCGTHRPCSGQGLAEFGVGVSALATLAFLGAGHAPRSMSRNDPNDLDANTPQNAAYAEIVTRALRYLTAQQDERGAFGANGNNYNYNHAIATLAIVEAVALSDRTLYRTSAEAALRFTVDTQQPGGGWDYTARRTGRNDLSVTGWQVMVLETAVEAGLAVPPTCLQRAQRFVSEALTASGEGIYSNQGPEKGRRGVNMSAVALLSHLYLAHEARGAPLRAAVSRLLRAPPSWDATARWEREFQSYYYWYTGTLALFHWGGEAWEAWNHFLKQTLLPVQSRSRHEDGSWPPEPNWLGASGGRVYATAISVLTLETYYRYVRLDKTR